MVSHHLAISGINWSGGSRDITNLKYYVTSQEQVIEKLHDIMGRSYLLCVTIAPSLLAKGIVLMKFF